MICTHCTQQASYTHQKRCIAQAIPNPSLFPAPVIPARGCHPMSPLPPPSTKQKTNNSDRDVEKKRGFQDWISPSLPSHLSPLWSRSQPARFPWFLVFLFPCHPGISAFRGLPLPGCSSCHFLSSLRRRSHERRQTPVYSFFFRIVIS